MDHLNAHDQGVELYKNLPLERKKSLFHTISIKSKVAYSYAMQGQAQSGWG